MGWAEARRSLVQVGQRHDPATRGSPQKATEASCWEKIIAVGGSRWFRPFDGGLPPTARKEFSGLSTLDA